MAFTYCPKCGFKNLYSITPPNFCGGCGESIGSSLAKKKIKPRAVNKRNRTSEQDDSDDPDGSDVYEVPEINSLAYTIEHDKNTFDLKDMLPEPSLEEEIESPKQKPRNKKRGRKKAS